MRLLIWKPSACLKLAIFLWNCGCVAVSLVCPLPYICYIPEHLIPLNFIGYFMKFTNSERSSSLCSSFQSPATSCLCASVFSPALCCLTPRLCASPWSGQTKFHISIERHLYSSLICVIRYKKLEDYINICLYTLKYLRFWLFLSPEDFIRAMCAQNQWCIQGSIELNLQFNSDLQSFVYNAAYSYSRASAAAFY